MLPPFRADHVGSLLRPPALMQARERHAAGQIGDEALQLIEDQSIEAVIGMQHEAGLQTVTDGEFRRTSWHMDFIYQLGGISKTDEKLTVHFQNASGELDFESAGMTVDGRVSLPSTIFASAFVFLRDHALPGQTPKLTIPSPNMVHYRAGRAAISQAVYPDLDEFWSDLTAAYAQEIAQLGELGCRYLQLDDTSLAYLNDPRQRERFAAQGGDAEQLHEQYVRNLNAAVASRPDDMRITTHMCRGNYRSSWAAEGGYDFVAEALFSQLDVDGFFLEFDDERSGGFEPLRFVPPGKRVVLGLVTTKSGALESKDDLKRRIDDAARYVPLEQLCLSPQCGFSSTVEGNNLSFEQEVAKLRLITETAREIWG